MAPDRERGHQPAAGWAALDATHLCVNTMGLGLRRAEQHIAALGQAIQALSAAAGD